MMTVSLGNVLRCVRINGKYAVGWADFTHVPVVSPHPWMHEREKSLKLEEKEVKLLLIKKVEKYTFLYGGPQVHSEF